MHLSLQTWNITVWRHAVHHYTFTSLITLYYENARDYMVQPATLTADVSFL